MVLSILLFKVVTSSSLHTKSSSAAIHLGKAIVPYFSSFVAAVGVFFIFLFFAFLPFLLWAVLNIK